MLASSVVQRSRGSASKRLCRRASAFHDLLSRSLAEDKDERNTRAQRFHARFQPSYASPSGWSRHETVHQKVLAGSMRVYLDSLSTSSAVSLSSFARSPSISGRSAGYYPPLLYDDSLPNQGDGSLPIELYRSPARTNILPRALRKRIHTSAVHAVATTTRPYPQTMQRVAYFSTQPDPPKEGSGSSSTSTSSSSSASFSTSATPSPETSYTEKAREALVSISKAILSFFIKLPGVMWFYLTHPKELRARLQELKEAAKKEAHHYYMGSKLLAADVRTAWTMTKRTLQGSSLTRRERKQLLRTVSDLFRLVPFSMFILIPFMEFALPLALRLFPNMLPSTFQDSLKAEENMKRELKSRINMAQFFQETLQDLVKEQKKDAQKLQERNKESENKDGVEKAVKQEESATSMLEFLEKARSGQMVPPEVIIQYATYFQDDLTLDNMPRMQLINMCKYMNIPPYGADSFLRFQLRFKIRSLKEDDQRILWEGIDSLTKMELREACQERGMRSTGLSKDAYKSALQQWLDLSVNKNVPISLLIMSRTFYLRDEMATVSAADDGSASMAGLADAISGLDKDVVNEVVLEVATSEEKKSNPDVMKIKLEVLEQQNERIREEREELEAAAKRKEQEKGKEKEQEKGKEKEQEKEIVDEAIKSNEAEAATLARDFDAINDTKITTFEQEKAAAALSADITAQKMETTPEAPPVEARAEEENGEDKSQLSTQEMDAISQLVNPDPVNAEREHLARIKAAMKTERGEELSSEVVMNAPPVDVTKDDARIDQKAFTTPAPSIDVEADKSTEQASQTELESKTPDESKTQTLGEAVISVQESKAEEPVREDESLGKAINRLKSKVESMVDKIDKQLCEAQVKIGDKMHFLDKDMDGIVSREEMALVLQQVLKRELTFEEALHIAATMDEDNDGVLTVAEFIRWIETNKLVKLLEQGRDTDIDSILAKFQENEGRNSSEEATDKNG